MGSHPSLFLFTNDGLFPLIPLCYTQKKERYDWCVTKMLITSILDDNDFTKLVTYQQMIEMESLDLSRLKKKTNMTFTKLMVILNEIQADLAKLTNNAAISLTSEPLQLPDHAPSLDQYRQFLLEHALVSQVLIFMLKNPQQNLADFCKEAFISRATAFRRLRGLKKLIAPFNVKLNITALEITGDELTIRYLLCSLFWYIMPGSFKRCYRDHPLTAALISELADSFAESAKISNRLKISLCMKLSQQRRDAGFYIKEAVSQESAPICQKIVSGNHQTFIDYLRINTPSEYIENEEAAFYTLVYSGPIYVRDDTAAFQAYRNWSQENPLTKQVVDKLCEKMLTEFFDGVKPYQWDLICANMVGILNSAVLLQNYPPFIYMFLENRLHRNTETYQKINQACCSVLTTASRRKNLTFLKQSRGKLAHLFTFMLLPLFIEAAATKKVKVAVTAEDNFILTMPLQAFLRSLPYVQTVDYHEGLNEAIDLVIAPHFSYVPEVFDGSTYLFTFRDITNNFRSLKKHLEEIRQSQLNYLYID